MAVEERQGARNSAARGARFTAVMTAIVGRLPFGLARLISPRLAGFLVISAVTFTVDLALLTAVHGGLGWPLLASITVAYTAASALGFLANRVLNFRSHGAVGPQAVWYAIVVAVNYFGCILGVTEALAALGTDYRLARIAAAAAEAASCIPPCAGLSSATPPGIRQRRRPHPDMRCPAASAAPVPGAASADPG